MKISNFITASIVFASIATIQTSCKKDIVEPYYEVDITDSTAVDTTEHDYTDSIYCDIEEPTDSTDHDDWSDDDSTYTEPSDTLG